MSYHEGPQCVANLGLLCDVVDAWEEEEIISYPELVDRLKYYRASDPSVQSQAVLSSLENKDAVKVATIHATKGLEFPIVFVMDVEFRAAQMWNWSNVGRMGVPPQMLYVGASGRFVHLRQFTPPGAPYEVWNSIANVYSAEPGLGTAFSKKMAGIYDSFVAEKWRLYYVALTRAKDHLFHGYNSGGGTAQTWGNEFRKRIAAFEAVDSKHKKWVSTIGGSPTPVRVKHDPQQGLTYSPNPVLERISERFHPLVIDPTHVYDLMLCPRRYQYGSLMGATGSRCDEFGSSQFSPVFGSVLHEMIEEYDYRTHDTQPCLALLKSRQFVPKRDQGLLEQAIAEYSSFISDKLSHLGGPTHTVVSEKQIQDCIVLKGRPTEFRGVIDLLDISDGSVNIYDIKSNYLVSSQADSDRTKLRKEFMRTHHEHQLLAYRELLERRGQQVGGIYVLAISKTREGKLQWNSIDVVQNVRIIDGLEKMLPLKVGEDGLAAIKNRFCPVCEYRHMCRASPGS